jgi:hypothetical protein
MNGPKLVSETWEPVPVRDSIWVITDAVRELFASPSLPDLDCWVDHALALIMTGGKAAREVPGWRTVYPLDDPVNEPDCWIWLSRGAKILCIRRDDHGAWQSDPLGNCDQCGVRHAGVMSVFTVLVPEEY